MNKNTIWFQNYRVLLKYPNEFFPDVKMSTERRLNALVRASLYIGVLMTVLKRDTLYLYIPILMGVVSFFIYEFDENRGKKEEKSK